MVTQRGVVMSLSIKVKIMLILLVGGLSVVIAGTLGLNGMRASNKEIKKLYQESLTRVSQMNQIMSLMRDNRIQLLLTLQHDPKNPEIMKLHDHPQEMHTDKVMKNLEEIGTIWKGYAGEAQGAEELKLSEDFSARRAQFVNEGLLPAREAALAGNYDEATKITLTRINPLFATANDAMLKLLEFEKSRAQRTYQEAMGSYRTTLALVIGAIVASILVSLGLGLMVIRSVSAASSALITASAAMADGDLSQRVRLNSRDEFGKVGDAFDTMADSFAQALATVAQSSTMVAAAAGQVHATADRIATGAEQVAAQSGNVATASEEMAATSGDIARSCQFAVDAALRATDSAQSGFEVVKSTIDGIRSRGAVTRDNARLVESLGTRSNQVGAIVETIEEIADQTNLLALNAAIEAARAGDQGRGFAVVADEVRALAERTTRATKEIGEMIRAIQSETREAIASMEEGVKGTERGVTEAAQLESSLSDIMEQVTAVSLQVKQIAIAAGEQTATTSEISANMMQITQVVQETVGSAQESATAAAQMSGNADELQRLVRQFNL